MVIEHLLEVAPRMLHVAQPVIADARFLDCHAYALVVLVQRAAAVSRRLPTVGDYLTRIIHGSDILFLGGAPH